MEKVLLRALTAYYRTQSKEQSNEQSNAPLDAQHVVFAELNYVLLRRRDSSQLVAVYRCMNRGELKRLKRWPATLSMGAGLAGPNAGRELPTSANDAPSTTLLLELIPVPKKAGLSTPDGRGAAQTDLF